MILLLAALATSWAAAPAGAAELVPGPTPLALIPAGPVPACPTTAEADGSVMAAAYREAAGLRSSFWASAKYADEFLSSVVTTVGVCDPDLAAARRPAGPITGGAVTPPPFDTVGFGLRMLGAPITEPGAAASVGDRFVLPAVGARSTVDVVVRTATGASAVRVGPFGTAPLAVRVAGTTAVPSVVAELADGTSATTPVAPAAAATPKLTTTIKRNRIKVRLTGVPGAVMRTVQAPSPGDIRLAGYDPNGVVAVADASGVATGTQSDLQRARFMLVGVLDADRRSLLALTCRLTWKGRTLRRVACTPTTPEERARPLPDQTPLGDRFRAPSGHPHPAEPAAPTAGGTAAATRARNVDPSAAVRAATPALAAVDTTPVARLRGADIVEPDETYDSPAIVGDANGDGIPDFGVGDPGRSPTLALSGPGGWREVPVKVGEDAVASLVPDLTGDAVDDFTVDDDGVVVPGQRGWLTTVPSAIALLPGGAPAPDGFAVAPADPATGAFASLTAFPDATGDGRPELGATAGAAGGMAVFASESVPLGATARIPRFQAGALTDDAARIAGVGDDGEDRSGKPTTTLVGTRGGALQVQTEKSRESEPRRSTITLTAVPTTPPWNPAPSATLTVAGLAAVTDYDATTGESLIATAGESCNLRTFRCISRIRRLDRTGRVIATASIRALISMPSAGFTPDGPDADDRPEVLIHDPETLGPGREGPGAFPGIDGTVALWSSAASAVKFTALPVLATGARPIVIGGPLLRWVGPDGRRHHAGYVTTGKGRRRTQTLTLLGPAR